MVCNYVIAGAENREQYLDQYSRGKTDEIVKCQEFIYFYFYPFTR